MITPNKISAANRQGIIWTVFISVLCLGRVAQADVATFVGSGCMLNLRVHDITEHVLTIEMRRADIERLQVGAPSPESYSDHFFIRNCGDEFKVKVVSMSEGSVILRLPRSTVATLEVGSMPGTAGDALKGHDVGAAALHQAEATRLAREQEVLEARTAGPDSRPVPQPAPVPYAYSPAPSAAYGTQSAYVNALRAYDAAQLSYSGYGAYGMPGAYGTPGYGAQGAQGTAGAYGTSGAYGAPGAYVTHQAYANAVFGSLRGRMLVDGKPYAGCRVTLRRLDTGFKGFLAAKERPQLFDAITDAQGVYRFEQLPEGPYDIYWIPPGKDYWVRLLKEGPTVVIPAGTVVQQPDINADMKVL